MSIRACPSHHHKPCSPIKCRLHINHTQAHENEHFLSAVEKCTLKRGMVLADKPSRHLSPPNNCLGTGSTNFIEIRCMNAICACQCLTVGCQMAIWGSSLFEVLPDHCGTSQASQAANTHPFIATLIYASAYIRLDPLICPVSQFQSYTI